MLNSHNQTVPRKRLKENSLSSGFHTKNAKVAPNSTPLRPLRGLLGLLASPSSFHLTFLHQSVARASRGSPLRADKWLLVWLLIVSALSLSEEKQYSGLHMISLPFSQQLIILSPFDLLLNKVRKASFSYLHKTHDENLARAMRSLYLSLVARPSIIARRTSSGRRWLVGWCAK